MPSTLQLLSRSASKCRISVSQTTDQIITDYNPLPTFLDGVPTIRALASVNILSNDIGAEQANALIKILESKSNLTTLCGFSGDETELDLSKKGLTVGCAVLVANEIKNNRALVKLDASHNEIRAEGGKALAEALKDNKIMKELNIASNNLGYDFNDNTDMSGVIAISNAIPTMGALETITFGDEQAATMKTDMTEADLSGKQLGASGAIIVAAFLPKCQ